MIAMIETLAECADARSRHLTRRIGRGNARANLTSRLRSRNIHPERKLTRVRVFCGDRTLETVERDERYRYLIRLARSLRFGDVKNAPIHYLVRDIDARSTHDAMRSIAQDDSKVTDSCGMRVAWRHRERVKF